MMIKRMLKFALPALLLAAGITAYAQEGETTQTGPVTLKDGETSITWEAFANALNDPKGLASTVSNKAVEEAQKAYDEAVSVSANADENLRAAQSAQRAAQTDYNKISKQLSDLKDERTNLKVKTEDKTIDWLESIITNADEYYTAWQKMITSGTNANKSLWYIKETTTGGFGNTANTLYISFENPGNNIPKDAQATSTWTEATDLNAFKTVLFPNNSLITLAAAYVYLGKDLLNTDKKPISIDVLAVPSSYLSPCYNVIEGAVSVLDTQKSKAGYHSVEYTKEYNDLTDQIVDIEGGTKTDGTTVVTKGTLAIAQETLDAKNVALDEASATATSAPAKLAAAEAKLNTAKNEYNAKVADVEANYNTVTLTDDITANVTINEFDGIINGGNHTITLGSGLNYLFGTFNGNVANGAINGKFANVQQANAKYNNVAYAAGSTYKLYADDGTSTTYTSLGELGFAVRDTYGVNFSGNTVVALTDATKVYYITAYSVTDSEVSTPDYVQINGTELLNKNGVVMNQGNTFIKSETIDLVNVPNVFYNDNKCDHVVIKDRLPFYCPVNITATNITLDRELTAGYNTVCLPFELSHDYFGENDLLCKYQEESPEKFWFTKVKGSMPANTPTLLWLEKGVKLELTDGSFTIKQTPDSQLVEFEGTVGEPSKAYGFFKNITADEVKGASNANKVYGLQGGAETTPKFNPAGTATFPAFRMVIATEIQSENGPRMARSIGIVDEKGIEINVGGNLSEIVDMEVASLNVAAGQGEIIITSDANFGMQTVYSIDGKAVATVDVVEGTTTVDVQSGIYVVMGQKVLVK